MSTVLVLRNCKPNLTSYNGFRWPASGPVECPDWNPKPVCGGGLHGLLWGHGNWELLSSATDAIWQVVEVESDSIVKTDDEKVKFPKGNVIFSGPMAQAVIKVLCHPDAMKGADKVASGNSSKAASSGDYSTAASSGDYSKAASSGNSSKAEAKGKDTIAMAAGLGCIVSAGENGVFASAWYDERHKRNRIKVGYPGRNGIKPNTPYRLTKDGKWEEVK